MRRSLRRSQEVKTALAGKILVDVTVPLVPPQVGRVQLPEGGSAVVAAQRMLGAGVRVVSAFQNVSAEHLNEIGQPIDCDVLVCGDDREARAQVIALAARCRHAGIPRRPARQFGGGRSADLGADRHQPAIQGRSIPASRITGLPHGHCRCLSPREKPEPTRRPRSWRSRRWPASRWCSRATISPTSSCTGLRASGLALRPATSW